jgi:hypothetical protein
MDLTGIVVLITISSGNPEPLTTYHQQMVHFHAYLVEIAQSDIFGTRSDDRPKNLLEWNSSGRLAEGTLPALCGA